MGSKTNSGWFIQVNGERRGPFPAWQLSRYLLLQRLHRNDLVSRDGEQWGRIGELPELDPQRRLGIADLPEQERQRLLATENWVAAHPALFRHTKSLQGDVDDPAHYHLQLSPLQKQNRLRAYGVVVVLLLLLAIIPFVIPSGPEMAEPQCDAPPAPAVNWSNCLLMGSRLDQVDLSGAQLRNTNLRASWLRGTNMTGVDLAYANLALSDLSGAQLQGGQLKGTNLRNANLSNANLEGADLSYADLSGVKLEGANLRNTRLGYAIWEENISCMPESVGKCIPARRVR